MKCGKPLHPLGKPVFGPVPPPAHQHPSTTTLCIKGRLGSTFSARPRGAPPPPMADARRAPRSGPRPSSASPRTRRRRCRPHRVRRYDVARPHIRRSRGGPAHPWRLGRCVSPRPRRVVVLAAPLHTRPAHRGAWTSPTARSTRTPDGTALSHGWACTCAYGPRCPPGQPGQPPPRAGPA